MGAVSTLPAFLDALKAALDACTGLADVNIFTGPVGLELLGEECIILASEPLPVDAEYLTAPKVQAFEGYDVDGKLYTTRPGGGEDGIKTARDRAFALLEEVHDCLAADRTVDGTVRKARLTRWTLKQAPLDGAHEVAIDFTIHAESEFTPA